MVVMSFASSSPPDWVEVPLDDIGDRVQLEMGEARVLVTSFILNGKDTKWLDRALRVTAKIYGKGADVRVRDYMRQIWKQDRCL